jgi:glycosyltransferase involved in cell wall biosynthesis
VITYCHEAYIRQALDSIFMQETDFDYEVIVGEDASPDGTRAILLEYKEKYPEKLRLILHDRNLGMNGNAESVLRACRGKYIANCEGDDYWTSKGKLQIQVDFLEAHPEYTGACHDIAAVDRDGKLLGEWANWGTRRSGIYTLEDFLRDSLPSQTASLVHRNFFALYPEEAEAYFRCGANGDVKTALWLTLKGDIRWLEGRMSAYRRVTDSGASWSAAMEGKNMAPHYMSMVTALDDFAYQVLGRRADFSAGYVKMWTLAVSRLIRRPGRESLEVLKSLKDPRCFKAAYLARVPWEVLKRGVRKLWIEARKLAKRPGLRN